MKKKLVGDYGGGVSVVWLPVNQAYLVMWHGEILRGPIDRATVIEYLAGLGVAA